MDKRWGKCIAQFCECFRHLWFPKKISPIRATFIWKKVPWANWWSQNLYNLQPILTSAYIICFTCFDWSDSYLYYNLFSNNCCSHCLVDAFSAKLSFLGPLSLSLTCEEVAKAGTLVSGHFVENLVLRNWRLQRIRLSNDYCDGQISKHTPNKSVWVYIYPEKYLNIWPHTFHPFCKEVQSCVIYNLPAFANQSLHPCRLWVHFNSPLETLAKSFEFGGNYQISHYHTCTWRMGNHDSWRHHIVVITVLAEYWVTFKVYMLRDHSEQAAPCPIVLTLINDHLHQGSPQVR